MPLENLDDLEAEWTEFTYDRTGNRNNWSQDQRWRADNPGKFQQLVTYRNGGARPDFSTSPQGSVERRMLEHLDAYREAKGTVTPIPTPTNYGRGIGYLKLGSSNHPPSNPDKYDTVALGGSGFPWPHPNRALIYTSLTNVPQAWSAGVPYADALANGWLLKDANGNYVMNKGFAGVYLGDVGNPDYVRAWCQNVEALVRATPGCKGFYSDDTIAGGMWWNSPPVKYPSLASWTDAMVSAAVGVYAHMKPRGIYTAHNAGSYVVGDPDSDNGALKMRFWKLLSAHTDGLMAESWIYLKEWGRSVRKVGPGWDQQWDAIRGFHRLCNGETLNYGVAQTPITFDKQVDFIGLDYGDSSATDKAAHTYCLATFLLDLQHEGSVHMWNTSDGTDPWSPDMSKLPIQFAGPAVKEGNVWKRGPVTVDPVAGTASIS